MTKKSHLKSGKKNLFEELFQHEIGKSMRLRSVVLIGLLTFEALSLFLVYKLFGDEYIYIFKSNVPIYALLIFALLIISYELIIHYLVSKKTKFFNLRSKFPAYFTTFSEISLLSILLIVIVENSGSTAILFTPAISTYFILIILSTLHLEFKLSIFAGFLAAIEFIVIAAVYSQLDDSSFDASLGLSTIKYLGQGIILSTAGIAAGFVARLIKSKMNTSFNTLEEKNEVIDLFGQHISQQIAQEILKHPHELTGTRKMVTILFLDIRNFTPFVEHKEPEEVVNYLNNLFGFMIDIVQSHHGIINQFLGDGFMATFGAPLSIGNSSENAVLSSHEILRVVESKIKQGVIPQTRLGIGIHFGEAITGNIGSVSRKQYTITGNVVILASRIEQLNKNYNSQLLISEEVFNELNNKVKDKYVSLGPVNVKGRKEPISIYQLIEKTKN